MPRPGTNPKDISLSGRKKPASLKMLSEHLGLSVAAISRVLSEAPAARSIPKATQDRIRAAAKAMNYQPNLFARTLRNKRSMTIGVMVPEVSEGYATLVLSGIEQQLLKEGYFYFVVSHHHRRELIEKYQDLLAARGVEGILAIDTQLTGRLAVPIVSVSGHQEPEGVTKIVLNHRRAAMLALEYLHKLGHRRIAFLKGQRYSSDTDARWKAIRAAAAKFQVPVLPELVIALEGQAIGHDAGYAAAQRLLASGAEFTAVFAFNDVSAIGAIRALREAGRRVPADVSVIGFDDIQSAAFQSPGLTTIRQPLHKMGLLAAQTLLEQIAQNAAVAGQVVVDPELVVRESAASPPTRK